MRKLSKTPVKPGAVTKAFREAYPGVDPHGVYCLFTGKKIGYIFADEWQAIIESIPGDADEVADDLAVRIFAAMRPSLRWNKLHRDSLDEFRTAHPLESLAYLLNRLLAPSEPSGVDTITLHHNRILVYNWLKGLDAERIKSWLQMMIEIDARLSLKQLRSPFGAEWLLVTPSEECDKRIKDWYLESLKIAEREEESRERSARWYRLGNTMSKAASVGQFMESRPLSQTAIKAQEKAKDKAFMSSVLATLMADAGAKTLPEGIEPPKNQPDVSIPKIKPMLTGKMPMFGVKKES